MYTPSLSGAPISASAPGFGRPGGAFGAGGSFGMGAFGAPQPSTGAGAGVGAGVGAGAGAGAAQAGASAAPGAPGAFGGSAFGSGGSGTGTGFGTGLGTGFGAGAGASAGSAAPAGTAGTAGTAGAGFGFSSGAGTGFAGGTGFGTAGAQTSGAAQPSGFGTTGFGTAGFGTAGFGSAGFGAPQVAPAPQVPQGAQFGAPPGQPAAPQAPVTLETTYAAAPPELRAQVDEVEAKSAEFTSLHAVTQDLIADNVLAFERFAARVQEARARLQRLRGAQALAEVGLAQLATDHSEGKSLTFALRSDETARAEMVEAYWAASLRGMRGRAQELMASLDGMMACLTGRGFQDAGEAHRERAGQRLRFSASGGSRPELARAEQAIFRANVYSRIDDFYGALEAQAVVIAEISERLGRVERQGRLRRSGAGEGPERPGPSQAGEAR